MFKCAAESFFHDDSVVWSLYTNPVLVKPYSSSRISMLLYLPRDVFPKTPMSCVAIGISSCTVYGPSGYMTTPSIVDPFQPRPCCEDGYSDDNTVLLSWSVDVHNAVRRCDDVLDCHFTDHYSGPSAYLTVYMYRINSLLDILQAGEMHEMTRNHQGDIDVSWPSCASYTLLPSH